MRGNMFFLVQACWLIEKILELTDLSLNFWYTKGEIGLLNRVTTKKYLHTIFIFSSKYGFYL